jgi:lipoyl(octanoyl) transferase
MRASGADLQFVEAGRVDYLSAWERQRRLAEARIAGTGPDTVLLLEHDHVYTAGKRTQPQDRPTDGSPVIDVDRGGRITWHGPGQLVGYPVVALAEPVDVVGYVRMLEQVLIAVCADLGLPTGRVAGRSGVWLGAGDGKPERKIAAIGVRIARGVAMHGFALNCNPDLSAFDRIVPCGIADAGVTSLTAELGRQVTITEATPLVRTRLTEGLTGAMSVTEDLLDRPAPAPGVDWQLHPALR